MSGEEKIRAKIKEVEVWLPFLFSIFTTHDLLLNDIFPPLLPAGICSYSKEQSNRNSLWFVES
jgi:hypothetical protein